MKAWILSFFDDSTAWRRAVLRKLGAFVARMFLFGSVFLFHSGERCVYETGSPVVSAGDVPPTVMREPASDEAAVRYHFATHLFSEL
jgi:hypothetical protein